MLTRMWQSEPGFLAVSDTTLTVSIAMSDAKLTVSIAMSGATLTVSIAMSDAMLNVSVVNLKANTATWQLTNSLCSVSFTFLT